MSSEDLRSSLISLFQVYIYIYIYSGSLSLSEDFVYTFLDTHTHIYIYIYIFRLKKEKRMHSSVIMLCPHNRVDCIRRGPRKVVKASDRLIILC